MTLSPAAVAAEGAAPRSAWWGPAPLLFMSVAALSFYVLFLALVLHPTFQAHNVFLHSINYPFRSSLQAPWTVAGMPARKENRARVFRVQAADGTSIAGWHIAPKRREQEAHDGDVAEGQALDERLDDDLLSKPIVLYFHGNALNRGAPIRIRAYKTFLGHNVNVVAIDYRGFGDSEGVPSEKGLLQDARAAIKWIRERRSLAAQRRAALDGTVTFDKSLQASDILIAGQSLGTGVASRLTLDLVDAGLPPAGVLLIAPYTSIFSLLTSYRIGGFLPLFWPLSLSSTLTNIADRHLQTRFESGKALYIAARGGRQQLIGSEEDQAIIGDNMDDLGHALPISTLRKELGIEAETSTPALPFSPLIVISHADNDRIIPALHGQTLFETVQKAFTSMIPESAADSTAAKALWNLESAAVEMGHAEWGSRHIARVKPRGNQDAETTQFISSTTSKDGDLAPLILFKNLKGGHNEVPKHAVSYYIGTALSRLRDYQQKYATVS